jgi:hypothetical protein
MPVIFSARQSRLRYRQEMRHLTYVTLDAANGGIIRNLNRQGVAVQAVAPLHAEQRVRLRFELRFPRLRVDTYGQVTWANSSGGCGIRFVDLPRQTSRHIDRWIFSNLLEAITRSAVHPQSIFAPLPQPLRTQPAEKSEWQPGKLLDTPTALSDPPAPPQGFTAATGATDIDIHPIRREVSRHGPPFEDGEPGSIFRWFSGPGLAWVADGLVVLAAWLLFTLTFLAITHVVPPWPFGLAGGGAAAVFVSAAYWSLSRILMGSTLGKRLASPKTTIEETLNSPAPVPAFERLAELGPPSGDA